MTKTNLSIYLRNPPQEQKDKYIFVVDSEALAENIMLKQFKVVAVVQNDDDFFDADGLTEYLDSINGTGTEIMEYIFLLCCSIKILNSRLAQYMKENGIQYREAWRLFKDKVFLEDFKNIDMLEDSINQYLEKLEPPKNNELDKVRAQLCYRTDSKGNLKVIQSVKNVEVVLAYDERFARKIRYDEFSNQIYLFGSMPWESKSNFRPWGGHDDSELFAVLQSEYGLLNRNDFFDGLNNTAHKNSFHQVRDYLDQLKWDGVSRIERFFIDFLGAADNQYTREVTKLLTAGAVARIYSPGTKFDYVVILQGAQGCGKSTAIRLLAMNDNWTSDSLDSLDSSSAIQILQGSWILELSELKSLGRTSGGIESVKRFLTATSDKCRLPYQRRPEVFPRQCVFIGSTNRTDYIDDQTGARRFLPIKCGENKPLEDLFNSSTAEYIRQLWAEAVNRYKRENPPLTLPRELLAEIEKRQSDIVTDNGWRGQIIAFLEDKTETCSLAIWRRCLGNTGNPRKYESTEINSILDSLPGWEKSKKVIRFDSEIGVQRGYTKIDQTQICNNVTNDKQELPPPDNDGFINLEGDINYNAPFE